MVDPGRAFPGGQTIGRAGVVAVAHVVVKAEPGVAITDCLGILHRCIAIQKGLWPKELVLRQANADLWGVVWQALFSS